GPGGPAGVPFRPRTVPRRHSRRPAARDRPGAGARRGQPCKSSLGEKIRERTRSAPGCRCSLFPRRSAGAWQLRKRSAVSALEDHRQCPGCVPRAPEEGPVMFEQVFENLRTVTEAKLQMEQELMKKGVGMWPGLPAPPHGGADQVLKAQKKWVEFMAELVKKQREVMEGQFSAGMKNIEDAFRLAEVKNPEE